LIVNEKYSYSSWYLEQGSLWVLPLSGLTLVWLLLGLKTVVGTVFIATATSSYIDMGTTTGEVLMMLLSNKVAITFSVF
jgi:hypothetical protein